MQATEKYLLKAQSSKLKASRGFTLIELLIYIAVFSVVAVSLTSVMITAVKIQSKQGSSGEVSDQLSFVLQNVTRLVQQSSLVEKVYEGNNQATACSQYCSAQLRMPKSATGCTDTTIADKLFITSDSSGVYTKECDKTAVNLVNSKVQVNNLNLAIDNVPGGHSILNLDLSLTYVSANALQVVTRAIHSAIGRASAATFDTDLLPSGATSNVGSSSAKWQNGWFSGNLNLGGTLTVGSAGTAISQIRVYSQTISPTSVTASSYSDQTFTVTGLTATDKLIVNPSANFGTCAVAIGSVWATTNILNVHFVNAGATCTPASSTWSIIAIGS